MSGTTVRQNDMSYVACADGRAVFAHAPALERERERRGSAHTLPLLLFRLVGLLSGLVRSGLVRNSLVWSCRSVCDVPFLGSFVRDALTANRHF